MTLLLKEDKFYIKGHHEPIISEDDFDKAQEIRLRRAKNRNTVKSKDGKREKFSRKYAFSCLLECGFCCSNLSRRTWHSNSQYNKVIWQCITETKKEKETLKYSLENNNEIKNRMKDFKSMLERKEVLKYFDRYVFESIVEKVIVGEIDEDGKVDLYKFTFVYKTGFKDNLNGEDFKSPRKNSSSKNKGAGKDSAKLSSYTSNHVNKSCSHSSAPMWRQLLS